MDSRSIDVIQILVLCRRLFEETRDKNEAEGAPTAKDCVCRVIVLPREMVFWGENVAFSTENETFENM